MNYIKILLISIMICLVGFSASAVQEDILKVSWEHYKERKILPDGRPLADKDAYDLANGSKGTFLSFSETVSYVLFRAVWINDKEAFDKTWKWAYENLMRKNIDVFNWHTQKWEDMPADKDDHLFAWRWTANINNSGKGGVIYYVWKPELDGKLWRAGYDVAPDGDELIAGALIFAHKRWGSTPGDLHYMNNAKNIIKDMWEKCVLNIVPGRIDGFSTEMSLKSWFRYSSEGTEVEMSLTDGLDDDTGLYAQAYDASYMGIGKVLGTSDFSKIDGIHFQAKGTDYVTVILEDDRGLKATFSRNLWEEDWEKVAFSFSEMDSPRGFNWDRVKNIMFQPAGDEFYLDEIRLYGGEIVGQEGLHLVANDQGQPWINVSYYMPFLYEIFAKIDPERPWRKLVDATYYDIAQGTACTLRNQKGDVFKGNGALVPDWFMYSFTGQAVDLPWAVDNKIDDYLSCWDAFRTWWFISVHGSWFEAPLSENIFKHKTLAFFKKELAEKGFIGAGYDIAGGKGNYNGDGTLRAIEQEFAGINGAYLALFHASGDKKTAKIIYDRMQNVYNEEGYWDKNKNDYYSQNWAWFGLAFYKDYGRELIDMIDELSSSISLKDDMVASKPQQ